MTISMSIGFISGLMLILAHYLGREGKRFLVWGIVLILANTFIAAKHITSKDEPSVSYFKPSKMLNVV